MKKLFISILLISSFSACKRTFYIGNYGQGNQTQVVLSGSNFSILGSFKGIATEKKKKVSIRDVEGMISKAKNNLLANAKAAGVELKGSRTLANVSVDIIENRKMVTYTVAAEIIEFTK
ncbi:MAG: hypothetical protein RL213_1140 [Bacteroidota bacterium]|jgi:ribosomal protein L17